MKAVRYKAIDWSKEFEDRSLEHMDALYRSALRLTRCPADAEDLVQETYLKAFRFHDHFQPGTNLRAWLFKIQMNSFINRYRKAAKEPAMLSFEDPAVHDEAEARWSAEHADESAEACPRLAGGARMLSRTSEILKAMVGDEVKAAIESLPSEFRKVVILSDLEGFSNQEVADILKVPAGTVKSRLFRARRNLQPRLCRYAREHGLHCTYCPKGERQDDSRSPQALQGPTSKKIRVAGVEIKPALRVKYPMSSITSHRSLQITVHSLSSL